RRLLIRRAQRVSRALPKERGELLVEADAGHAVVSLEKRIEIGTPECRGAWSACALELAASDDPEGGAVADRDAHIREKRRVVEIVVGHAVVRRRAAGAERVVEAARRSRHETVAARGPVGAAFERR